MAALCPVIQKNNSRAKDGDYKTTLGETIKSPSSGYEVLEFLGKGTFGQVGIKRLRVSKIVKFT